jgi:hypothetical protein
MAYVATYVGLADHSERTLAQSLRVVADGHGHHPDVLFTCQALAQMSEAHVAELAPIIERYGEDDAEEPERLHAAGVAQVRPGGIGLLRDLQDLHLLATLVQTTWTVLGQGAQGLRDPELTDLTQRASAETARQLSWLNTRMKAAAPQTLVVGR